MGGGDVKMTIVRTFARSWLALTTSSIVARATRDRTFFVSSKRPTPLSVFHSRRAIIRNSPFSPQVGQAHAGGRHI